MARRAVQRTITYVSISRHALQKYCEATDNKKVTSRDLANLIRRRLLPQLSVGLEPDADGAVHIHLGNGLHAVAVCNLEGGWGVLTVLRDGMVPKGEVG